MNCSNCHNTHTTCTCEKRCVTQDCTCPVLVKSDCVNEVTVDLECSAILKGKTLNEVLVLLDAFICEKFGSISSFFALISTGTGAEVYKGIDNLGRKQIRSLVQGGLITITQGTNDITIAVNQSALTTYIQANQKTYSVANTNNGAQLYKNTTVVGDNTQFNFRTLNSSTLSLSQTTDGLTIDTPQTATIPALYVNNLYVPTYEDFLSGNTKGQGTLAKPFTDTVNYTNSTTHTSTPNTAIQNALDAYVGTGSRLSPQLSGQQIIIQNNNSGYTFAGDFNYTSLNLKIEGNVISTNTGYIVNMDNPANFDAVNSGVTVELGQNVYLEVTGNGFLNSGSVTSPATYQTGRILRLLGNKGTIVSNQTDISKYLLNANPTSSVLIDGTNDGNSAIFVECSLAAPYQGIYKVGGNCLIDIHGGVTISSSYLTTVVNTSLKAFHQVGGEVRLTDLVFSSLGTSRVDVVTMEATNGFTPKLIARQVQFQGYGDNWFTKLNSSLAQVDMVNCTSLFFGGSNLFQSPNLWAVNFRNNILENISVDFSMVDFTNGNTISSINTIGSQVIESLRVFATRLAAVGAGLSKYSAFINRKTITAGSFIPGVEYIIGTVGTTNFTLVGAASNTVGLNFIATGVGTGTGTAYSWTRDILL